MSLIPHNIKLSSGSSEFSLNVVPDSDIVDVATGTSVIDIYWLSCNLQLKSTGDL